MRTLLLFLCLVFSPIAFAENAIVNLNGPNAYIENGQLEGFDIDLLNSIGNYNIHISKNLDSFFKSVKSGDIGLGGISITREREERFDFVPYMKSGLKIASSEKPVEPNFVSNLLEFRYFRNLWEILHQQKVYEMLFAFMIVTLVFAHIIWWTERKSDRIDDSYLKGLGQAIYFSIVTQSTVGYGDITVKHVLSRILTLFMIMLGISMFGTFTGLMTANIVENNMQYQISSLNDLKGRRVGVKVDSLAMETAEQYSNHIVTFDSTKSALDEMQKGNLDAVVGDGPELDFLAKKMDITIIPKLFKEHDYGFVFPEGDERTEFFRRRILALKESGQFEKIRAKWF